MSGSDLARQLQAELTQELGQLAEVVHWRGDFPLSETTIEGLEGILHQYDFAVLLFTPDDALQNPAKGQFVVRDNVLFEAGLFMGRLGRERTFVALDLAQDVKVPSDLRGVTYAVDRTRHSGAWSIELRGGFLRVEGTGQPEYRR